jgi:hypothetical protein
MMLPHHQNDWRGLPNESAVLDAIRDLNLSPGNYGFPRCDQREQMNDPEFQKRQETGPRGLLSLGGPMSMGRNMFLTFLVFVAVSVSIAYIDGEVLPRGTGFARVFQVPAASGVLAGCFSFIPNGIWFNHYPRAILMNVIDGAAYGLITGAIFAALWPR